MVLSTYHISFAFLKNWVIIRLGHANIILDSMFHVNSEQIKKERIANYLLHVDTGRHLNLSSHFL